MNRNFKMVGLKTFGQRHRARGQIHVKNFFANVAMKMAVRVHVRAKTRRAAIQRDLPREAGLDERIETIINGRVGNFRHLFFCAHENFVGRRMIAFVQQHVINLLALRREAQTRRAQLFGQVLFVLTLDARFHRQKINARKSRSQDLE
jgi:hypothetical protein